jgi:glutamate--cysteine ligase
MISFINFIMLTDGSRPRRPCPRLRHNSEVHPMTSAADARNDDAQPIESRDQLIAYLEDGCKPKADWRIGAEHEKFGYYRANNKPVPYEGPNGVAALLRGMQERSGWEPVYEGGAIIGLKEPGPSLGGSISLEPGGQFELSGAPLEDLHQSCEETTRHLEQAREAADPLGVGFLGLGFSPKWRLDETPRMPKGRYQIMSGYMPRMGDHGLDMMYRTCTVQTNLDFSDEADMVKKLRVALALQPAATAIFANSPFTNGKPNGFLSFRAEAWRDVDPDRTGLLPFAFESGMGFERYVDYALDVPMYFVYRDGVYIDVSGSSFRDFLAGKLAQLPRALPTMDDWVNHLSTIFPEARLKRYLEMRGADAGSRQRLCALPALWTGLFYDAPSLEAAWALVKNWTPEERCELRSTAPKEALKARFRRGRIQNLARDMLEIARDGLRARRRLNEAGRDETIFLDSIEPIIKTGQTAAEELLIRYERDWGRNIDPVFEAAAF